MLLLFPSMNLGSILWFFTLPTQILPPKSCANLRLCFLLGLAASHQNQISVAAPVPIFPSPHFPS